jgi:hypothetical protein
VVLVARLAAATSRLECKDVGEMGRKKMTTTKKKKKKVRDPVV